MQTVCVPVGLYTVRVMGLDWVMPSSVYVNVPLSASLNAKVALPTVSYATCAGFQGVASNEGPVVR